MLKGFKEFVLRGNVIDLAVAVVIGAAFTAVVNSLVENVFNPLLGALFKSESLNTAFVVAIPTLDGKTANVAFGAFLGALIQFVLVAAVVYFVIVVPMNHFKRITTKPTVADEPAAPSELSLLTEIRDLLKTGESSPLPPARDDTTDGR
ncbi:large conductance mechanosensitive channel protein MscL [Plantibacter sp. Mn2098]|uniref:large conductance mechanosensitive channel protein MscL n=1 Tax=Plantibacter sp. Mn2098 TaxID=3395266 RepID=UPI003BC31219